MVSGTRSGRYEINDSLVERGDYLPHNHVFSVKVYQGQYLYIADLCVQGSCQCIYFLDGIPHIVKPCRFAASLYIKASHSENDIFVLTGICRGFHVLDCMPDLGYSASDYNSITRGDMKDKMDSTVQSELIAGQI